MEIEAICVYCGKKFIARDRKTKYCSKKCKDIVFRTNHGIPCNTEVKPYKKNCAICGKEFETYRQDRKTCSPECAKEKRRKYKKRYKHTKEEYLEILKVKTRQNAEKKVIEDKWYKLIHTQQRECKVCGSLFYCMEKETRCTCSAECSKKYGRRKNDKRINKDNLVDIDITLNKLYERDEGICWLCGKTCDWNDYIMRENVKICGKTYPSIDHVIPLARGGKHQWENVRLAHLSCNVAKSDTTPTYTKEMSREHARKLARERCTNKKKTAQYTLTGELIKVWESTAEIKRVLGLSDKTIQNVCRKEKSKTGNAYGYHWEYVS